MDERAFHYTDRKQETKIVKEALRAAGFGKENKIRVTHGHGTVYGWLYVSVTISHDPDCRCFIQPWGVMETCNPCKDKRKALTISGQGVSLFVYIVFYGGKGSQLRVRSRPFSGLSPHHRQEALKFRDHRQMSPRHAVAKRLDC